MVENEKKQFDNVDQGLLVRAPAKINLSLLVAGKRTDGFHEIETLMAKVTLYDELVIQQDPNAGVVVQCAGPFWAPQGKDNLVHRACELLLSECGCKTGIKVSLTKNIPAGSGLGSASSDAAAALLGLKKLLALAIESADLARIAARLGSDVGFFLDGPLALCTGRGEKVHGLDGGFDFTAVLVLPDVSVSTADVYANYRHEPSLYHTFSRQLRPLIEKKRFDLVTRICANMLEKSCFDLYRELAELKAKIESLEVGPVCLSGSGSAMFCVLGDNQQDKAEDYRRRIRQTTGCTTVIVSNNRW